MALFDLSPDGFPWRAPRPHEIETRRAQLSDLLIFDILLSSGGVRHPDTYWPPTDPESLRRLLEVIEGSAYDTLKKDCLIYFLLKWHQDGREERFREDRCIPPQFAMLSDAYWHLDSGISVEVRHTLYFSRLFCSCCFLTASCVSSVRRSPQPGLYLQDHTSNLLVGYLLAPSSAIPTHHKANADRTG
jgi:hypothetical protein